MAPLLPNTNRINFRGDDRVGIYAIRGNVVVLPDGGNIPGQDWPVCRADDPRKAAALLDRAYRINHKGRSTEASRLIQEAEDLAGFAWANKDGQV